MVIFKFIYLFNVLKMYLSFILLYFFVLIITYICNNYIINLEKKYKNKIIDVENDINCIYKEYKFFCITKDKDFNNKLKKEDKNLKNRFYDLQNHLHDELRSEKYNYKKDLDNIDSSVKSIVFENNIFKNKD